MNRTQRFSLLLAVGLFTVGLSLAATTALAAGPDVSVVALGPIGATAPSTAGLDQANVIDPTEYRSVVDFTQRVTPYITVGDDGVPRLADVEAAELGVDPAFLADFERAMVFANQALANANIVVNADLTLQVPREASAVPIDDVVASEADVTFSPQGLQPIGGDAQPNWGAWNYPQGAMFYNSYEDYWQYYYNRYYVLSNSLAAYLGYPWLSGNLVYFYTYNGQFFNNNCYRNFGSYFFMPYGGGCQQYYPCFGGGLGYRPVYFWVRTYTYDYRCGCPNYVWGWQGYWSRY